MDVGKKPCEDTARRYYLESRNQKKEFHQKPTLLVPGPWSFSLWDCEKINVCCVIHQSVVFCFSSPSLLINTECLIQPLCFIDKETEAQGMTFLGGIQSRDWNPGPLLPGAVIPVTGQQECERSRVGRGWSVTFLLWFVVAWCQARVQGGLQTGPER